MELCDKVVFGCVIFPQIMQYMEKFIRNLRKQTTQNYFLLMINDGICKEDIESKLLPYLEDVVNRCKIIDNVYHASPEELRVVMLLEAKKIGDFLIIGDADDLFSYNRIRSVYNVFKENDDIDFVYNDLKLFDGSMAMPLLPDSVTDVHDILHYNFLGMSNTSLRVNAVDEEFILSLLEPKQYVFDWYMHTRLLLDGHKGMKCKNAYTLYRIYADNFVGIPGKEAGMIKKEIEIKTRQYDILRKYDAVYEKLYRNYLNNQIEIVEDNNKNRFWWSNTRIRL